MNKKRTGKSIFKRGVFAALALVVASGIIFPTAAMAETSAKNSVADAITNVDVQAPQVEKVNVEGENEKSEKALEDLNDNNGIVMFAAEDSKNAAADKSLNVKADDTDTVVFSYDKIVRYENWFTRRFTVEFDGKKQVAYCIEPEASPPDKGTHTAVKYDNELMKKALYYSYGYPGYETTTKPYLAKQSIGSDYSGEDGQYVLSHLVLSYLYDNESDSSDGFKGVKSSTRTLIKNIVHELKTNWQAVPEDVALAFDKTKVKAEWNKEKQCQETSVIKLYGHKDNKITVTVPEGTTLVKMTGNDMKEYTCDKAYGGEAKKVIAELSGGDEFYFTAASDVKGSYESGQMTGSLQAFQPYVIAVSGKQDILYCGNGSRDSVSFSIKWVDLGDFILNKMSASPEITDNNDSYSLEGARYEIYGENGKLYTQIETDAEGHASTLLPYGEYSLKEKSAPRGYIVDTAVHELKIDSPETVIEHREQIVPIEKPEQPSQTHDTDTSPKTGDDDADLIMLGIMASIAAAIMIAAFVCRKQKV